MTLSLTSISNLGLDKNVSGLVCKGDFLLGSACGTCARCLLQLPLLPEKLKGHLARVRDVPTPSDYEWEVIWRHHNEQQYESANKELYDDASWHKRRAEEIRAMLDAKKAAT